jgi:hypothetical protein
VGEVKMINSIVIIIVPLKKKEIKYCKNIFF